MGYERDSMKQKQTQNPQRMAIGCVGMMLCGLVFIGLFFYANNVATKPYRELAHAICNEYDCDAQDLINNHMDKLQLCEIPVNDDIDYSVICLEGYGVDIIP